MKLLNRLYVRVSQLPEFIDIVPDQRKRVIAATRWKIIRHWQYWIAFLAIFIFSMVLAGIIGLWYLNLHIKLFSQLFMSISAVLSTFLLAVLLYLGQNIKIYFLSPYIIKALPDRLQHLNVQDEHARQQQIRKKTIRRGVFTFAFCLLILGICMSAALRNPGGSIEPLKIPAELNSPRVITNKNGLTKKILIEDARLGSVTDIIVRTNTISKTNEIILAGTKGALFNGQGLPSRFISFDKKQDHVNFIKINSLNAYGFMNRGSWCCDARVMDDSGHLLWSYGRGVNGIDDMVSGDLDGDGNPEYAVGFNGGGGIQLLNSQGKKLWEFSDGNVWHVEIADIDGSGHKKIVHSNAGGEITVRDIQGKIISKNKPNPYFSDFSLIRWPNESAPERLLLSEQNKIWIFDTNAKVIAEFAAPFSGNMGEARGVLFTIKEKPFLATVVDFENWQRSILYLHNLSGMLVYQEILPESCPAIAVLPIDTQSRAKLALGCDGKVIEYQLQR